MESNTLGWSKAGVSNIRPAGPSQARQGNISGPPADA